MFDNDGFWKSNEGCGAAIFDSFLAGFLGWLVVYHDFTKGGVAMFLLAVALRISMFLGLIPVLGQVGYWFLAKLVIIPFILNKFQIENSWLVDVFFWFNLVISVFISFLIIQTIRQRSSMY